MSKSTAPTLSSAADQPLPLFIHREQPYCCPVCEGRGSVHAGFYTGGVSSDTSPVQCRVCSGKGVIWR
jgi:DnaJ-class molecular chaperone